MQMPVRLSHVPLHFAWADSGLVVLLDDAQPPTASTPTSINNNALIIWASLLLDSRDARAGLDDRGVPDRPAPGRMAARRGCQEMWTTMPSPAAAAAAANARSSPKLLMSQSRGDASPLASSSQMLSG